MEERLLNRLERIRKLMIQSGKENGLCNEKTVRLSKEFDVLMNQYENKKKSAY